MAHEALRLSDHEFDVAFASALRDAATPSAPPTGPLKQLADRITAMKAQIAKRQQLIAKLMEEGATGDAETSLELAKAQLALDEDELTEAKEDLARQGGDPHAKLEQMLQAHEAAQHGAQQPKAPTAGQTSIFSEQLQAWLGLRDRQHQIEAARRQAADRAARLAHGHEILQQLIRNGTPSGDVSPRLLERFRHLSDQSKTLAELDKRILDIQQLADVYKRWNAVIETRKRGVVHQMMASLAGILALLLAVVIMDRAIRYAFLRHRDRKRMHQLRVMATIAVQFVGAVLILFIIFGLPNQISTILGLATAGLTVVLKDFIVAFFGWFALMGKNGIRIGDWVEIEGVGGEVIEIGILKTVLLEMGNWTNTGHPTGRRVSFVNTFAMEKHYFNFSTEGQWLWDELHMTLPDTRDAYNMATQIRDTVEQATETDARLAEQDWERVTRQYQTRAFSAKATVDLRPTISGLEVVVRYITRAPQRYEVKSRLFQQLVTLIHKPTPASSAVS